MVIRPFITQHCEVSLGAEKHLVFVFLLLTNDVNLRVGFIHLISRLLFGDITSDSASRYRFSVSLRYDMKTKEAHTFLVQDHCLHAHIPACSRIIVHTNEYMNEL